MDLYHIWFDLKPGERDLAFAEHLGRYLARLRDDGLITGFRLTRRKLGFGAPDLGEFHVIVETADLAQLERAFQTVSTRAEPIEGLHQAVNARVQNFQAALYRDFPDPHRKTGEEKF
jgi:hypothetical protein